MTTEEENTKADKLDTYYPLPKEESVLGASDEAFAPWMIYNTLQSSIQFADFKINLLFVIGGIMLSMVISSASNFSNEHLLFKVCFGLFIIFMLPFLYYSVKTIAAHTKGKPDVKSRKLYFFGEIASMPTSEYIKLFRSTNRQEHYDELLLQIHNLSHITKEKFYNYGKALYLLCVLMVIMIVMLTIKTVGL